MTTLSRRERGGGWIVWTADYADFRRWPTMRRAHCPRVLGSRLRGNDGAGCGNDGLFTLTLGPPLNLPLGGGGRWLEGRGFNFVLCFFLDSRLRGKDGITRGKD